MPLKLVCTCGTELTVAPELIGRNVRCPTCRAVTSTAFPTTGGATSSPTQLKLKQQSSTRTGRLSEPTRRIPVVAPPPAVRPRRALWLVLGAVALAAALLLAWLALR